MFGVISATRGVVHLHFGEHSFNAQAICDALQEVRVKVGDGVKLAMAWDNARIHRAKIVQQLMATEEVNIEPVWNVTARPDLASVGIEQVWARAKYLYRCEVDRLKALNRTFHHMGLVQNILGRITDDFAKKLAAHSVPAVMAARPIAPLPNEQLYGPGQFVHHSPMKQNLEEHQPVTFDGGFILQQQSAERQQEAVEDPRLEENAW